MRKVVLNLAVSLDGFIARKNGAVDWLDNLDTDGSDLGFSTFLGSVDTIIMGRKSYETTLELGNGVWPFKDKKTVVFTRQELDDIENIHFTNQDPVKLVNSIKQEPGSDIWMFGGASLIGVFRELNLIDEYIITTIPTFIGNGIRLFDDIQQEANLELVSMEKVNSIVQTVYKVKR